MVLVVVLDVDVVVVGAAVVLVVVLDVDVVVVGAAVVLVVVLDVDVVVVGSGSGAVRADLPPMPWQVLQVTTRAAWSPGSGAWQSKQVVLEP